MKMRILPYWLSPKLMLFSLAIAALPGCYDATSAQSKVELATSTPSLTVSLISPRMQPWSERVPASGSIQPWQLVTIGAEVNGVRVVEVMVRVGDSVKKGQLLARLNNENLNIELDLQRATLAEAHANYEQTALSLSRAKRLDASRAISQQDLLQYETAAKTAAAKMAMAQAQIKSIELRIKSTRVVAPDDGVVAVSSAAVGALSNSSAELFKIIRKGRVEWQAELRPEQQEKVKLGQLVEVKGASGLVVSGRVRQIAPMADLQSRTLLIYVDVPSSNVFKPGALVTGEFLISSQLALTVPHSAVVVRDGFNYAMSVDANQMVNLIKLELGLRRSDAVQVLSGLTLNDKLIESGGSFLYAGDKVKVVARSVDVGVSQSSVDVPPANAAPATVALSTPFTAPSADEQRNIEAAIHVWIAAWSNKDIGAYLDAYAQNFSPTGGESFAAWAAQRNMRIVARQHIHVQVAQMEIAVDGDRAKARFLQTYQSDGFNATHRKTLELGKVGGRWLMLKEYTGS